MPAAKHTLLPKEQMELQISQIDLLMGMYPGQEEIVIDSATKTWLDVLREWATDVNEGSGLNEVANSVPAVLSFDINVQTEANDDSDRAQKSQSPDQVQLYVEVPVRIGAHAEPGELSLSIKVRLRQPTWMSRTQTSQVNASVPADYVDDVFGTIEYLRDEAARHLTISTSSSAPDMGPNLSSASEPVIRVWFYFPSLSTRAKRADLVTYAPVYNLTGFVLAGKPGILCLEGTSKNVDGYMKYIKTESWGDIPSHHKKVSEKHREVIEGGRVFNGMQEITDAGWMGEKRGERGNRNDLRALEGWLDGIGLKGVFEKVLL